jgi:phytoene dehydrogenase-like protein
MKKIVVVGSGINGLVAANYLAKNNFHVTIIEKKETVGGACVKDTAEINGKDINYAHGATVLGMMQKFVFEETGLDNHIKTYFPKEPKIVYFNDPKNATRIFQDNNDLCSELEEKWNEKGNVIAFRDDENKVIDYLQNLYRNALIPSVESARKYLGDYLTKLWIEGSAYDLLNHYFTSEKTKLYLGMTVIESGPTSLYEQGSAINIPLMDSGSIFNGYWGFVKDGIWKITEKLSKINLDAGVDLMLSTEIRHIDTTNNIIYYSKDKYEKKLSYDYIFFATDPITPSKILGDKLLTEDLEKKDWIGTSGKITLFFKNPIKWKYTDEHSNYDTSFRFIFYDETLKEFEKSSQDSKKGLKDYIPGYIQIYPEGAAQRKMGNIEDFDKVILFTKNFSFENKGEDLNEIKNNIISGFLYFIENPEDLIDSKFITPKDLNEIFLFPKGNIDHLSLSANQNFDKRSFSSEPHNNFYKYSDYSNIYYCGAGSFPCGSVAGTPGYMSYRQFLKAELKLTE